MEFKIFFSGLTFLTMAFLGSSLGDNVIIRLPQIKLDNQGRCRLPLVFDVAISPLPTLSAVDLSQFPTVDGMDMSQLPIRDGVDISQLPFWGARDSDLPGDAWEIRLLRSEIAPTSSYVYVMRQDDNKKYFLELQKLDDTESEVFGSYHNYSFGAAVTIKCVNRSDGKGQFYRLEGTVFKDGRKYILSSSLDPLNPGEIDSDHEIALYDRKHVVEHKTADASWIHGGHDTDRVSLDHGKTSRTDRHQDHRVKRQTSASYSIDILTFIDVSMYRKWLPIGDNDTNKTMALIKSYMMNIYTSVNLRLKTLDLKGITLRVRMLPLVFPENDAESPWTTREYIGNDVKINATKLLNAFRDWLKVQTSSINNNYDHAVLLTSYDLYGGSDSGNKFNITKGLAYIGTVCQGAESSSIIEEKGAYQSEGIIAHELGHSLGAKHDGVENLCQPETRYLMSDGTYPSTPSNYLNPWRFSQCSSAAILNQIEKLMQNKMNCLEKDIPSGDEPSQFETKDPTKQCQNFYGADSFACRGLSLPSFTQICDEFYCHVPGTIVCERMTAPLGMCCGNQKKCIQGVCENAASGECIMDGECPLGDQPGIVLNNKTCSQLESAYCYDAEYNVKCCKTCKEFKAKFNQSNCVYGDKKLGCGSDICDTSTEGISNRFFCCKTCQGLAPVDVTNIDVRGDVYTCQELINKSSSYCYEQRVHVGNCPIACESARDETNPSCPWGDRNNCTPTIQKLVSNGLFCPADKTYNCCKSCADIATTMSSSTVPSTTAKPTSTIPSTTIKPTSTVPSTTTKPTSTVPSTTAKPTSTIPSTTIKPTSTVSSTTTRPTSTVPLTTITTTPTSVKYPTDTATTKATVKPTAKKSHSFCDFVVCTANVNFDLTITTTIVLVSSLLSILLN